MIGISQEGDTLPLCQDSRGAFSDCAVRAEAGTISASGTWRRIAEETSAKEPCPNEGVSPLI